MGDEESFYLSLPLSFICELAKLILGLELCHPCCADNVCLGDSDGIRLLRHDLVGSGQKRSCGCGSGPQTARPRMSGLTTALAGNQDGIGHVIK